jgi:hypothetical protein
MLRIGLAVIILSVQALALQTQYITFEHPEKWTCENAQGTYICQSTQEPDKGEALIMSVATIATEWDTLENYQSYLKNPKTYKDDEGNDITSEVSYVHKRKINGVEWIDSLQYNPELPGFWTRYLATVQNKLAILVTYLVSDDYYRTLAPQFERLVSTLKPNAEFDINASAKPEGISKPGTEKLGREFLQGRLNVRKGPQATEKPKTQVEEAGDGRLFPLLALLAGILGIWFVMNKRKKKGPPTNPTDT